MKETKQDQINFEFHKYLFVEKNFPIDSNTFSFFHFFYTKKVIKLIFDI